MGNVDLRYVVGAMAALSGIPVRLFEGEQLVLFKSPVKLPQDPAALYRQEICSVRGHVGYFATPCFHYYGVLNAPGGTIVMGPTCQIMAGEQELRELAFRLKGRIPVLDERKRQILDLIIQDYVDTAVPVGSRTITRKYSVGVSPATIRNEMSDLEALGYLEQPHVSAGRVPSVKAYRLYVDDLIADLDQALEAV